MRPGSRQKRKPKRLKKCYGSVSCIQGRAFALKGWTTHSWIGFPPSIVMKVIKRSPVIRRIFPIEKMNLKMSGEDLISESEGGGGSKSAAHSALPKYRVLQIFIAKYAIRMRVM